ncbi:hypothetical protein GW17_00002000 [Ensete ventricosum]|nr:hypothetical protein GW17_00002000 [Ensete ventricosum]
MAYEGSEEEGQPGMARPYAKGLACRGGRMQPRPPCKGAADYSQGPTGWPPVVATTLAARVAAPWQGGCRPQRAAVACAGQ